MKLIERIASLVGLDVNTVPRPELVELRNTLDKGRHSKRTEHYQDALAHFDTALVQAAALKDQTATPIVQLHRADVLIKQQQWDEAQALLKQLETQAHTSGSLIQHAYTYITLGTLHQEQGDLNTARTHYEHGLEIARRSGSAGAEGRAMGHLADTYLIEGNASYAVHLLRDALVKLNNSNDMELSSYFVGRLGEALIQTGHETEGDPLLDRALRLAHHMNYRTFERLWHLVIARRATVLNQYPDAHRHYTRILALLPADQETGELLPVLSEISLVCLKLGKNDDALSYAQRALALQPDDPLTRGIYGKVLHITGDSAAALPHLLAAVAYGETHPHAEHIDYLRLLAGIYADSGEDTQALATYTQALTLAQTNHSTLDRARISRDLGAYHAKQQHLQDAIKYWAEAVTLYESLAHYAEVARLSCDIADLRLRLGYSQRAMKDYEQALMVLSAVNDSETRGIVLANAAIAYVEQGDVETAEAFFTESIKIAQKLNDARAEATRRGNYGWFLLVTGRMQRAIAALEYAHKQSETLALTLPMAVQTNNLALAKAQQGLDELALQYYWQALDEITKSQNRQWLATIRCNLAAQLLKMAKQTPDTPTADDWVTEAATQLNAARANALEFVDHEFELRLQVMLAKLAWTRGEVDSALQRVQDVVLHARRTTVRRLLAEALYFQSELHAHLHQSAEAQSSWEESRKLFETLHHPNAQTPPKWLNPTPAAG